MSWSEPDGLLGLDPCGLAARVRWPYNFPDWMACKFVKGSRRSAAGPTRAAVDRTAEWRRHAIAAERAVSVIRFGDRVFVGSACAMPRTLLRALEAMVTPVAGVQLVHFLTDGATAERDGRRCSAFRHHVTTRLVDGTYEVKMLFPSAARVATTPRVK